jgi:arylsulfatase A-like enzyme
VDAGVGKVLQALDRKGLRDSTLVVFTADHGEGFDPARGRTHHGGRLHADLLRVPLLIAGPGVEPGETDQRTSLVDVMPTVLEALGVPAPGGLDGRSVVPWLQGGRAAEPRSLYAMDFYMWWQGGRRREDGTPRTKPLVQAVVRGGMWYVRSPTGEELYADDDVEQRENLVGKSPRLGALQELASARRPVAPVERAAGSPEVEKELRALGYIR